MNHNALFKVDPTRLVSARRLCHAAVQWPSRAARANLPAADDDSHSSLEWDGEHFALVGQPLGGPQSPRLGFAFDALCLVWLEGDAVTDRLPLTGVDDSTVRAWCDERLAGAGLLGVERAEMPYELDPVDYRDFADKDTAAAARTLGAWYAAARQAIAATSTARASIAVAPPALRCWPHHFDLAVLFALEGGDPEHARSIGLGFSPGDGSYAEPYFYCTPWPAPESRPEPPDRMHWHTEGFVSLVAPASALDGDVDLAGLLTSAVDTARATLGAG